MEEQIYWVWFNWQKWDQLNMRTAVAVFTFSSRWLTAGSLRSAGSGEAPLPGPPGRQAVGHCLKRHSVKVENLDWPLWGSRVWMCLTSYVHQWFCRVVGGCRRQDYDMLMLKTRQNLQLAVGRPHGFRDTCDSSSNLAPKLVAFQWMFTSRIHKQRSPLQASENREAARKGQNQLRAVNSKLAADGEGTDVWPSWVPDY